MTKEEVKELHSMLSIVESYGFRPNRAGFIQCPFHKGDRDASMKIYKDSFHCFGCGENGDIFSFMQLMDNITFREAFLSLGGTYEKPTTFESKMAVYHAKQKKKTLARKKQVQRIRRKENNELIDIYRDCMKLAEPLSDFWCECYNKLQYQLYIHDVLRKEVGY